MDTLQERLKQLRLPGLVAALESRNAYALEHKISYLDFLELLLEDEWTRRQYQQQHQRLQQSKLHQQKRLDNYEFSYQPELDGRRAIKRCSWTWPPVGISISITTSSSWVNQG